MSTGKFVVCIRREFSEDAYMYKQSGSLDQSLSRFL